MIIMIFFYRTTASFKVREGEDFINEHIFQMTFSSHCSVCSSHFIYCTQFKLCPEDRRIHSLIAFSVTFTYAIPIAGT